jgi:hypothetical protein
MGDTYIFRKNRRKMTRLASTFVLSLIFRRVAAFLVHPISSHNRIHGSGNVQLQASTMFPGSPMDVSSGLISQLAVIALKLRLASQSDVSCDVTANPFDLMRGRVGRVTVSGQGWASAKGLTCRSIEAQVDSCELDIQKIFTDQKLRLTVPAEGKAVISLNAEDFTNFITHPLMVAPKVKTGDVHADITFNSEGTRIDTSNGGSVFFSANFNDRKWKCVLKSTQKNGLKASIGVAPADANVAVESWKSDARQLSQSLSEFFNKMVFELDGTYLSFRDMEVTATGSDPSVTLLLDIRVRKFPSKGLDF